MGLPDITPALPQQIASPQAIRLRTFLRHVDASLSTRLSIYVYGSAAVALYLANDSPKYEYGYFSFSVTRWREFSSRRELSRREKIP